VAYRFLKPSRSFRQLYPAYPLNDPRCSAEDSARRTLKQSRQTLDLSPTICSLLWLGKIAHIRKEVPVNSFQDILFLIIGIAAITAFVVALFDRPAPQPPQVIYVQAVPEVADSNNSGIALLVLCLVIGGLIWLGL
jgi:hypothetical protein